MQSGKLRAVVFIFDGEQMVNIISNLIADDNVNIGSAYIDWSGNGTPAAYMSVDDGATWENYTSGAWLTFAAAGSKLRYAISGHTILNNFGSGIYFDGTDDNIIVPDSVSLSPTGSITIECQVKLDGIGGGNYSICKFNSYVLSVENGTPYFFIWSGANLYSGLGNTVNTGVWYHLAGVWDGSWVKCFMNGSIGAFSTLFTGKMTVVSNNLLIGGSATFREANIIDEVRITGSPRYSSNFVPDGSPFSNDAVTSALYHLDSIGTGSVITDSSSNNNNGSCFNGPYLTEGVAVTGTSVGSIMYLQIKYG